jgi:hypothetical protein
VKTRGDQQTCGGRGGVKCRLSSVRSGGSGGVKCTLSSVRSGGGGAVETLRPRNLCHRNAKKFLARIGPNLRIILSWRGRRTARSLGAELAPQPVCIELHT